MDQVSENHLQNCVSTARSRSLCASCASSVAISAVLAPKSSLTVAAIDKATEFSSSFKSPVLVVLVLDELVPELAGRVVQGLQAAVAEWVTQSFIPLAAFGIGTFHGSESECCDSKLLHKFVVV